MSVLVVTGTGTEIGKTIVTAAVAAAAADRRVAVLKPAQTGLEPGEPGDAAEVARLAGAHVTAVELARFPEPLAPATAARRAGMRPVRPHEVAEAAEKLAADHDLVWSRARAGCSYGSTTRARPWRTRPGCWRPRCWSSPRPVWGR